MDLLEGIALSRALLGQLYHPYKEEAVDISVFYLIQKTDLVVTHVDGLSFSIRVVLIAFRSALLGQIAEHDDALAVLLPHHSPELVDGGGEGSLGGDDFFFISSDRVLREGR